MDIQNVLAELMRRNNEISQADLARETGVAQPTINKILSGNSKNPSVYNVAKLAAYFGITVEQIFGIEPLPENLNIGQPTTGDRRALVKHVPVIGQSEFTDDGIIWSDIQYSFSKNQYIKWHTTDSDAYALRCTGDAMLPRLRPGEYIIIEPNTTYAAGDEVLIKSTDGRTLIKQFLYQQGSDITLYSINENQAPIRIPKAQIDQIQFIAGTAKQQLFGEI